MIKRLLTITGRRDKDLQLLAHPRRARADAREVRRRVGTFAEDLAHR
jgi:hypothetical protein